MPFENKFLMTMFQSNKYHSESFWCLVCNIQMNERDQEIYKFNSFTEKMIYYSTMYYICKKWTYILTFIRNISPRNDMISLIQVSSRNKGQCRYIFVWIYPTRPYGIAQVAKSPWWPGINILARHGNVQPCQSQHRITWQNNKYGIQ